jgi:diaminopimelate decarboxylase
MEKKPFVTKEKIEEIIKTVPTPFHLYDEKGIRENARAVKEAFSWNPGFREYFAVKATPTPALIKILGEYDCGCDCSSMTELMLSEAMGFDGNHIMFSSNDTPPEEYKKAADMGAIINLDDLTAIDVVEKTLAKRP